VYARAFIAKVCVDGNESARSMIFSLLFFCTFAFLFFVVPNCPHPHRAAAKIHALQIIASCNTYAAAHEREHQSSYVLV
jgi:hypothetical protein